MSGDVVASFIESMRAAGIVPLEEIGARLLSGAIVRFRCEGDKPKRRNGWAILYLDQRPAGAFGCYRMGARHRWKAHDLRELSPAERAAMQREWAEARRKREAEQQAAWRKAAASAATMLADARPASSSHPYLARKGMTGSWLRQLGQMILVPMYDIEGQLWNLQRISPDGTKRFLFGGRTVGLFWIIGEVGSTLCIGEGVATMDAVHRATGHSCVAAFSADGLLAVAQAWREARPDLDIVICADDDAHLVEHPQIRRNVGMEAAVAAARAANARLAVPPRVA